MLKLATVALLLSAGGAAAAGLPIKGAYGGSWACAAYAKGGLDAVVAGVGASDSANDANRLVTADVIAEPGRRCSLQKDGDGYAAACDGYTNTVLFKKKSKSVIYYGEAHAGTDYRRCK